MIVKIQSFTDVITNSSSSVFVMRESDIDYYKDSVPEDCLSINLITPEWIKRCPEEADMVCELINVDLSEISTYKKSDLFEGYGWWETPDQEAWDSFVELHKDKIEKAFKDLYWIDIEDHFVDAYDIISEAYKDAVWSENRH